MGKIGAHIRETVESIENTRREGGDEVGVK